MHDHELSSPAGTMLAIAQDERTSSGGLVAVLVSLALIFRGELPRPNWNEIARVRRFRRHNQWSWGLVLRHTCSFEQASRPQGLKIRLTIDAVEIIPVTANHDKGSTLTCILIPLRDEEIDTLCPDCAWNHRAFFQTAKCHLTIPRFQIVLHVVLSNTHREYGRSMSVSSITSHFAADRDHPSHPESMEPSETSQRRANASFVILARNSDVNGVVLSVRALEDRFNRKYGYPYVFLNEVPFSDDFKRQVSRCSTSICANRPDV
jgi:hypothetical protein